MSATSPSSRHVSSGLAGLAIALCLILVGRLATLELTNLIDPTEARYATVPQEMLISGNWLIPHIQLRSGMEPYLGKPPLHFWMTAISYSLLGIDEWTARLPSFVSLLIVLGAIWILLKHAWKDHAWTLRAMLICLSIPVFFFLAGSSVIDVTLTAFISLSIVCFFVFFQQATIPGDRAERWTVLATVTAALAFLTKGPIALVLIALPLISFLLVRGRIRELRRVRWILLTVIFLAIVAPWFIAAERQNPGFIRYFVWNENIARYLFKQYGDKYGSGHVLPYGSVWLMFFGAILPWMAVLILTLRTKLFVETRRLLRSDDVILLGLVWTLAPLLFFSFVRQLHIGYIIPALPGFAVFAAGVLRSNRIPLSSAGLGRTYGVLAIFAAVGGMGFGCSPLQLIGVLCFLALGYILLRSWARSERSVEYVGVALITFYLGSLCLVAPWLSQNLSSGAVLDTVVAQSLVPKLRIGSFTESTYSLYWESNAWKTELGSPITVSFVNPANPTPAFVDVLLVQDKYLRKKATIPALHGMIERGRLGQWVYFVPKNVVSALSEAKFVQSGWDRPIRFQESEAEAQTLSDQISELFR